MAGKKGRSGRKPKALEQSASNAALAAIKKRFGDDAGFFEMLAKEAKTNGSFNHAKLLASYAYGQPKQEMKIASNEGLIQIILPEKGKDDQKH